MTLNRKQRFKIAVAVFGSFVFGVIDVKTSEASVITSVSTEILYPPNNSTIFLGQGIGPVNVNLRGRGIYSFDTTGQHNVTVPYFMGLFSNPDNLGIRVDLPAVLIPSDTVGTRQDNIKLVRKVRAGQSYTVSMGFSVDNIRHQSHTSFRVEEFIIVPEPSTVLTTFLLFSSGLALKRQRHSSKS